MFSKVELSDIITETDKAARYKIPNHYRNWALVYLEKQEVVAEFMLDGTTITPIAKIISKEMPIGLTEPEKRIVSHIVGKYQKISWRHVIKATLVEESIGVNLYEGIPASLSAYFALEKARQICKQQERLMLPQQGIFQTGAEERESRMLQSVWRKLNTFLWLNFSAFYWRVLNTSKRIALFYVTFSGQGEVVAIKVSPSGIPLRFIRFCIDFPITGIGNKDPSVEQDKDIEKAEWLFKKLEGTEIGLVHWKPKKLP